MPKIVVAKTSEIPRNGQKMVTAKGRPVVIFNLEGEWFALSNRCPHQGGELCKGRRVGLVEAKTPDNCTYSRPNEFVRCPWHGWEFDIRTGKSVCAPDDVKVRSFDVSAEKAGDLKEALSVETFEITVEDELLVLTM